MNAAVDPVKGKKPARKARAEPSEGKSKQQVANEKLDAMGIDEVCAYFAGGNSQNSFLEEHGISCWCFSNWLADNGHTARAKEAMRRSARYWEEKADEVLSAMGNTPGSIARARELASHYRWRAKMYAPRDYGDKVQVSGDPEAPLVTQNTTQVIDPVALSKLSGPELDAAIAIAEKLSGAK